MMPASYYTFDETFPDNPEICETYNPSDIVFSRLRASGGAVGTLHNDVHTYPGPCKNQYHFLPVNDGYRTLLGICLPPQ